MKNFVKESLIIVFSILLSLPVMSQSVVVPDNIMKAFSAKFPDAKQVRWDKESASEYEAEFLMNSKKMSASFDNNANWIETETGIPVSAIPVSVKTTLKKDFRGYKVKYAELSETPDKGKIYEVTIEKNEQNMEVAFDGNGKAVKKEKVKDEDNDKDDSGD